MNIPKMLEDYLIWIKSETTFEKIGEYYEITTPYLDNANDYLQIYVKKDGDEIFFTDDSAILHGLKMNGIQLSKNRKLHLQKILRQYGVQLEGDALVAKASLPSFAQKKHFFIQAMLRVDDMLSLSKAKVSSFFLDDIQDYFTENEIYYSDNVQFTGISGFLHNYDFLIQRTKTKPERFCQAINNPTKSAMTNTLFSWNDTQPARNNKSQLIVILNDKNRIPNGIVEGFRNYQAEVIPWSERNNKNYIELLSA